MRTADAVLLAVGLLLALSASEVRAADPDPSTVLQRFVGTWTTETHIRHLGPSERAIDTRGKATCQSTLGGRYVEFRSETIPPGDSDLQIMTYDGEAGVYRQWVFSSDGYRHAATGTWDPQTSTLRWEGNSGENSFVILDHWVSPDRLQWTLTRKSSAGQTLQTIRGTVTRAK